MPRKPYISKSKLKLIALKEKKPLCDIEDADDCDEIFKSSELDNLECDGEKKQSNITETKIEDKLKEIFNKYTQSEMDRRNKNRELINEKRLKKEKIIAERRVDVENRRKAIEQKQLDMLAINNKNLIDRNNELLEQIKQMTLNREVLLKKDLLKKCDRTISNIRYGNLNA